MTVPASKRTESRLEVHVALDELVGHTLTKVENANKFGRHPGLASRIEDAAVAAGELAWRANDVRVTDAASRDERHRMQERAIWSVDALLYLVRLTRKHCGLTGREVKSWSDKAVRARDLLRKWRDSDARRYGRL